MKVIMLVLSLMLSGTISAQSSIELMGETKYLYTAVRQVIGVTYKPNNAASSLFIGYDRAFSDRHNFGIGYQYSYTLENGFGVDANVFGRFGKELHIGSTIFGGAVHLCTGRFVLKEAIGFHYNLSKKYFENRLSLTPFARISFAQGFNQVQEVPNTNLRYTCEKPLRDVTVPYLGIRTSFRL
jgi:hypothetical protein